MVAHAMPTTAYVVRTVEGTELGMFKSVDQAIDYALDAYPDCWVPMMPLVRDGATIIERITDEEPQATIVRVKLNRR